MRWNWTPGAGKTLAVAIAVAACALAMLWLLPYLLVDHAGPPLDGAERTKAVTEERRTVLAGLAAIGAALTLWYTHQRQELDRDANRTDRYTKAVEQLGDDTKPSVQLGGVYALERVAIDSERDRAVSIEVLSAFIRERTRARAVGTDEKAGAIEVDVFGHRADGGLSTPEPVLAALSVLARRPRGDPSYPAPNLMGAQLRDAYLTGANLRGALLTGAVFYGAWLAGTDMTDADLTASDLRYVHLRDAILDDARLVYAKLHWAKLRGASLTRATLVDSNLTHADLQLAKLNSANLAGANLTSADLTSADLTNAIMHGTDLEDANLTYADLSNVRWDERTIWPNGFTPPPR